MTLFTLRRYHSINADKYASRQIPGTFYNAQVVASDLNTRYLDVDAHSHHTQYRNFATCLRCHRLVKLVRKNIRTHFEEKSCTPRGKGTGIRHGGKTAK